MTAKWRNHLCKKQMVKYFIDESGHSGDLASNTGNNFDFEGQPYFALAAVGVSDPLNIEQAIVDMRSKHRIPSGELKSKSLQSKPSFVADLLTLLMRENCQLFVEVVDKRFFACTQLVNHLLLRTVREMHGPVEIWRLQNLAADWLYDRITEHALNRFVDACRTPSDHTLMSAFGSLFLITAAKGPHQDVEFSEYMEELVRDAIKLYGELRETDSNAFLSFLPVPDDSKSARKIWMLPNLTSLTNLYARINKYHGRLLAGITLVHDQQLQLDAILRSAKLAAESIGPGFYTPYSDYEFIETAILEFVGSHRSIGIQCADVLAGTVMRYFRDTLNEVDISGEIEVVMRKLLGGMDSIHSFGIMQVVPGRMVLR
jgi:hypothetical protein